MPADDATVITSTSRCATWLSSCARTASSSSASRVCRIPVVTHTTDRSGERPVANAFGTAMSATPTRGLGMSARAQSRSIIPCSSGASSGDTSRARMARMATLSELHHCQNAMPTAMSATATAPPGLRTKAMTATTRPT